MAYIQQMRDNDRIGLDLADGAKTPGFTAVGIFLFFGAIMAGLAATTLLWRGTPLDRLWDLNPIAYKQLASLGGTVGILFLLLGAALTTAGIGWFRRRLWGWKLAVVIIATQVLWDVVNCIRGDFLRGGTGVIIARCTIAVSLATKSQSHVCLESLSEKLKKDITNERGYRGNFKIGGSKDISNCPSDTPFLSHARALKFSHQEIRIEQEDDKTYLDHRSPDIFLHSKYQLRCRFD